MKAMPHNVSQFNNPYQNKGKFYHKVKGHTGIDYRYKVGDILLSPITGKVVKILHQAQMGKTIYIKHNSTGDIWVFAHNKGFLVGIGDSVKRLQETVITGNTGTATTGPHVHMEVITQEPINPEDKIMTRSLAGFKGYNTNPQKYITELYKEHNIDLKTGKTKSIPPPSWFIRKVREIIPKIPDWIGRKKEFLIPDEFSMDVIKPLKQGDNHACTVFACFNAWMTMRKLRDQTLNKFPMSAISIHKIVLAKKYDKYDPKKSVGVREVLKVMKKHDLISSYRKITISKKNIKKQVALSNPVVVVINTPKTLHCVCIIGYTKNGFTVYDSSSGKHKTPLVGFKYVREAYIFSL